MRRPTSRRACARLDQLSAKSATWKPGPLPPIAVQEVQHDALLALVDCHVETTIVGIVLCCLTKSIDRFLMMALRLHGIAQAAPGFEIPEFQVGPSPAEHAGASPAPRTPQPRTCSTHNREQCLARR